MSSSVIPFSSCLQSFPTSGSFPMSQLFAWGGQNIGVSASTSVLPMYTQDWSPLGWTGWISLQSKGLKSLLQHHSSKASILLCSAFFMVQLSHPYMSTGKPIALTIWTFVSKVMYLFNLQGSSGQWSNPSHHIISQLSLSRVPFHYNPTVLGSPNHCYLPFSSTFCQCVHNLYDFISFGNA